MATATAAQATDAARTRRARATVRKARKLTSIRSASVADAADALDGYDDVYLECRDLGHHWAVIGYYRVGAEIRRQLQCRTCPTQSTDVWRSTGERISRRYAYPDGYLIVGGGVTRADVRKETLNRVTVFESEAQMVEALFTKGKKK